MAGADEEYFQEELQRRLTQIGGLRDELWALRDRADDAEDRTSVLQQNVTRLQSEVGIRKAKANGLEDQAALEQAKAEDLTRQIRASASAGVAEVARLRQRMAELDQAYFAVQADAEEAQQLVVQKEAEVGALRAVLEARSRDAERARNELAQDEAAQEARQQRAGELCREQGAAKIRDAEGLLAIAAGEARSAREELKRLERGLASERECTGGLEKALLHTAEQHQAALEEAGTLEREVGAMSAKAEEEGLEDELSAARMQAQHLAQDLANARRHALMQTQSLQGALEETRRMITDHKDQTRRQAEKTLPGPNDAGLAMLTASLSDARTRADSSVASLRNLERERDSLEEDVRQAEKSVAEEREKAGRDKAAQIEEELNAARHALDASSRRVGVATEDARRVEAQAAETERNAQDQEALLRSKLEELWRVLRLYSQQRPQRGQSPVRAQSPLGSRTFQPPLRSWSGGLG